MLTQASMQKVTRAAGLAGEHLGNLLDKHVFDESKPKLFMDLLRYGAVHFEQVDRAMHMKAPTHVQPIILNRLIPESS